MAVGSKQYLSVLTPALFLLAPSPPGLNPDLAFEEPHKLDLILGAG